MEYISNVVIQDGESESVHRFPARKQHEEFWGWWRNLQSLPLPDPRVLHSSGLPTPRSNLLSNSSDRPVRQTNELFRLSIKKENPLLL